MSTGKFSGSFINAQSLPPEKITIMTLTDSPIRTANPKEKPYKLPREKGLFVLINPNGSKWWRLSYTFEGKEKMLSLGVYPEVSPALARERRDDARVLLVKSIDPSTQRQADKARKSYENINTFGALAHELVANEGRFHGRRQP